MKPEVTLPFLILITVGLGALVIAGFSAFVAVRGPLAQRREALAACFAAFTAAVLIGAVAVTWVQP